MNFHLQVRDVEGISIFDLNGRLVIGAAVETLGDAVSACVADGNTSLVLNLEKVPMIDSTGLGALIAANTAVRTARGAVKLLHLSERHLQLLVLTRLTTEFEMFNDEQAAVDSFFPDRQRSSFDILEFVQSHADEPQEQLGEAAAGKTEQ